MKTLDENIQLWGKVKGHQVAGDDARRQGRLDALEQSSDETGWAQLGTFGSYLNKLQPDFDSRNFGFKKLSDLVKAKTAELAALQEDPEVLYGRWEALDSQEDS